MFHQQNQTSRRCIYMWYFYSMRSLLFVKIIDPPWGCFLRVDPMGMGQALIKITVSSLKLYYYTCRFKKNFYRQAWIKIIVPLKLYHCTSWSMKISQYRQAWTKIIVSLKFFYYTGRFNVCINSTSRFLTKFLVLLVTQLTKRGRRHSSPLN